MKRPAIAGLFLFIALGISKPRIFTLVILFQATSLQDIP